MNQKTLNKPVTILGIGLHCGQTIRLIIRPAPVDHGIVFQRNGRDPIEARHTQISSTELSTTIGVGDHAVATVEHLMAAFFLLGIDNAFVEVFGPEVPILDGSAKPFIEAFQKVGLCDLRVPRCYMVVKKAFKFIHGEQSFCIEPSDKLSIKCSIEFLGTPIGKQSAYFSHHPRSVQSVGESRTFCHIHDVNKMQRRGLALGGSLDNAVVVSHEGILNQEGLRTENEFAKHKLLDLIGDFYLLGFPLVGRITAFKPGHTLHAKAMEELIKDQDQYISYETKQSAQNSVEYSTSGVYAFG